MPEGNISGTSGWEGAKCADCRDPFPLTISRYRVSENPRCVVSRIAPENIAAEPEEVLVKTLKDSGDPDAHLLKRLVPA